jgi:hypothetical protein
LDDDSPQSQDDIDALISGAAGGDDAGEVAGGNVPQSQDDIDALLSGATGGEDTDTATDDNAPQSQDDIDALISGASGGEDSGSAADDNVPQSQDDIDALISGTAGGDDVVEDTAPQSQDDIDSLISGAAGGEGAEAAADDNAPQSQDDIDALISGGDNEDLGATVIADSSEIASVSDDEIANILGDDNPTPDESKGEEVAQEDTEPEKEEKQADTVEAEEVSLQEPVADEAGESEAEEAIAAHQEPAKTAEVEPVFDERAEEPQEAATGDSAIDDAVSEAFDEVSPELMSALGQPSAASSSDDILKTEAPVVSAEPSAEPDRKVAELSEVDIKNIRETLSLMEAGTEIEGITGEIASLLGQLSERARRYQNGWQTGNQEVKELRGKLRAAEKQINLLNSEKLSLQDELISYKSRVAAIEEEHSLSVDKNQTDIATLNSKLREREGRINQLESEVKSLNQELSNAHNSVANSDVESRRAAFGLERVKNELESERQERARLQRMLEMREQELQAVQARSAGEASSLFLDELHRLIRRLESELNVRTGAARDALKAVENLSGGSADSSSVDLARKSLLVASGLDENSDALRELSRMSEQPSASVSDAGRTPPGAFAISLDDLSRDLDSFNIEDAALKVSRIISEKTSSPVQIMERVYNSTAMHSEEVCRHLVSTIMMLRNLHETQAKIDATRGRETTETERLYVQMFDLLHKFVRMKAINKSTPDAWRFFLDIRGRYTFITSDAQWEAYKNKQLR